jgi:hypothetical protein
MVAIKAMFFHHRVTEVTEKTFKLSIGTVIMKAMGFTTEFSEDTEKGQSWE